MLEQLTFHGRRQAARIEGAERPIVVTATAVLEPPVNKPSGHGFALKKTRQSKNMERFRESTKTGTALSSYSPKICLVPRLRKSCLRRPSSLPPGAGVVRDTKSNTLPSFMP